jgi:PAS domain S-box-containing protein
MGVLALIVAAMYGIIAATVVPRLGRLPGSEKGWLPVARWGALVFFAGCAITHVGIGVDAFLATHREMAGMEHVSLLTMLLQHVLPHVAQIIGGSLFIVIAHSHLELTIMPKSVAEELRGLELQFRTAFRHAPLGTALVGPGTQQILQANPALGELRGGPAEELTGQVFADLFSPAEPDQEPGRTGTRELIHRDGHRVLVTVETTVVLDDQGAPSFSVVQLRDVTAQRRTEVLRSVQQAVAQSLSEAESVQTGLTEMLREVCQTLGWSGGEYWQSEANAALMQRQAYWHAPELQGFSITDPADFAFAHGGGPAGIGLPIRTGDQPGVLLFLAPELAEPDQDLATMLEAICAHVGRFVERRRAEELSLKLTEAARREQELVLLEHAQREIATREAMLSAVLANSPSLIYVKDLDGRFLLANEPFLRLFSVTADELIGQDDTFLDPVSAPVWQANDRQAQQGEFEVTEWVDRPDGRHCYESVKFPLYDGEGRMYAICGISLDVTTRQRASEAMAEAIEAAVSANTAKSAFLATMSHEIRTPMNAVIGMTDLLLSTELDPRQHEYVETIRTSGDSLLSVINNILDYSRFEAGQVELEDAPFELRRCVEDSLAVAAIGATGLDLVADIDSRCPQFVRGDAAKLRQVLVNLVGNAVKFTERGDILVTVGASSPVSSTAASGSSASKIGSSGSIQLSFSVRDTGIGIPADRMDRLFKSFSQIDASTTRVYGGTGLGLAISRAIVRAMGGDLTASSEVGVGSTFRFELGFSPCENEDGPVPAPVPDAELAGRRVLVVDDNATNRRVLSLQLTQWGMSCVDVEEPEQALALLRDGARFDLAILDMNMPGLNGAQLAVAIRELPGGGAQELPLVLLTSLDSPPVDPAGHFAGFSFKPIRAGALHLIVQQVLTGETAPERPAERPWIPRPRSATTRRVLLAEDNLVNQKVAQGLLHNLGHVVDIVDNGEEALIALRRNEYDVVLMDIHMPVLDGLQATRQIRAELPPHRQPYIVALTASSLPEDQNACTEAGMNAYLLKPVRAADLGQAMRGVPWSSTIVGRRLATLDRQPPPEPPAPPEPPPTPEPPAPPAQAVDFAALTEVLSAMGDPSLEGRRELVEAYLEQGDRWIPDLTEAASKGDAATVRQLSHTLGSSSTLLGAQRLGELLREAELLAQTSDPGYLPAVQRAATEYPKVATALRAHLEHAPAGTSR